jgi:hypothetical protein
VGPHVFLKQGIPPSGKLLVAEGGGIHGEAARFWTIASTFKPSFRTGFHTEG